MNVYLFTCDISLLYFHEKSMLIVSVNFIYEQSKVANLNTKDTIESEILEFYAIQSKLCIFQIYIYMKDKDLLTLQFLRNMYI